MLRGSWALFLICAAHLYSASAPTSTPLPANSIANAVQLDASGNLYLAGWAPMCKDFRQMENAPIGNNLSKDELDQRTRVALNKIRAFVRSLDAKLPGSKDYGQNEVDQVSSFTSGP